MYESLKETLRGLTEDEQWAQEAEQAEKEQNERKVSDNDKDEVDLHEDLLGKNATTNDEIMSIGKKLIEDGEVP